jgi:hypothetical protein
MRSYGAHVAIGGGIGAGIGTGLGYLGYRSEKKKGRDPSLGSHLAWGGLKGGIIGGLSGHSVHEVRKASDAFKKYRQEYRQYRQGYRQYRQGYGGHSNVARTPEWLKGVTTKAEAKKRYKSLARTVHPDLGGSPTKMRDVNAEWTAFENSPLFEKLAYVLLSFYDELSKITNR